MQVWLFSHFMPFELIISWRFVIKEVLFMLLGKLLYLLICLGNTKESICLLLTLLHLILWSYLQLLIFLIHKLLQGFWRLKCWPSLVHFYLQSYFYQVGQQIVKRHFYLKVWSVLPSQANLCELNQEIWFQQEVHRNELFLCQESYSIQLGNFW